jgi:dihydroorotate dehydrogenase electron transfer subunit
LSARDKGSFLVSVLRNDPLSASSCVLALERPDGFPDALPGQFISVRISDTFEPLLRRPYSIMDLTTDSISLLVKVVGGGSALLASQRPGASLDIIGPLGGTSFPYPASGGVVLVAGGTGLAPFIFAARSWRRGGAEPDIHLIYGAEAKEELLLELIAGEFAGAHLATIDGSEGYCGDVVGLCERLVATGELPVENLYSCGPRGMVRALVEKVGSSFAVHLTSLETIMACGVGACRGCTVPVWEGERMVNKAVCSDGTVFAADTVAWDEWRE